jgi:hypothetical protein
LAGKSQKSRLVDAVLLAALETVVFLVGHAVDVVYGLSWGAVLIFVFNFLLVIATLFQLRSP